MHLKENYFQIAYFLGITRVPLRPVPPYPDKWVGGAQVILGQVLTVLLYASEEVQGVTA